MMYLVNMNKQETIQVRIDAKTKQAARETLDQLGLDMSSAIKLFLTNVVNRKGIPMDLRTENGYTLAQEYEILEDVADAEKNGERYSTPEEIIAALEK